MTFLTNLLTTLLADGLTLWTKVSATMNIILGEVPDDEIAILHGAFQVAGEKLKSGGSAEEAFTAALNFIAASELQELSKVGMALLNAFIAATEPKAA